MSSMNRVFAATGRHDVPGMERLGKCRSDSRRPLGDRPHSTPLEWPEWRGLVLSPLLSL